MRGEKASEGVAHILAECRSRDRDGIEAQRRGRRGKRRPDGRGFR
jgi:hypothetical protein